MANGDSQVCTLESKMTSCYHLRKCYHTCTKPPTNKLENLLAKLDADAVRGLSPLNEPAPSPKKVHCDYDKNIGLEGGALKYSGGKPKLSLIPRGGIEGAARALEFGMTKYGRNNWRAGFKDSDLIDASLRHIVAYVNGEEYDSDSGCCHLENSLFGIMVVLEQRRRRAEGAKVGQNDLIFDTF